MSKITKPTKAIARKVLKTIDCGLTKGLGKPIPGEMCIEAAVAHAMGEGHNDNPSCVGGAVRKFKIGLNDVPWSSNEARAAGLRAIGIAQLGSNTLDQVKFSELLALATIRTLLPALFRYLADKLDKRYREMYLEEAKSCEGAVDLEDAKNKAFNSRDKLLGAYAASDASSYAYAAACASSYAYAATTAAAYASDASSYASYASDAAAYASSYAYAAAYASDASSYAYAAAYASDAYAYDESIKDKFLILSADICLSVLMEMQSPGCRWLDLLDEPIEKRD